MSRSPLLQLADAFEVETEYEDVDGVRHLADPEALVAVVRALGGALADAGGRGRRCATKSPAATDRSWSHSPPWLGASLLPSGSGCRPPLTRTGATSRSPTRRGPPTGDRSASGNRYAPRLRTALRWSSTTCP